MGNKDIRKEPKKRKKSTSILPSLKPVMPEPELVKKSKKSYIKKQLL